jgi:ABC-type dipeptide/oligopeptide/nickel transport system permease subunit
MQSGQANGLQLDQNYPNPFNPETTIPFSLGEDLFVDGRPAVVTIRIFNILTQLVAHPVALRHPSGEGVLVDQLEFTQPGRYEAYWDGTDQMGRQVASGIYLMQVAVNGFKPITRKMYVMK